MEIQNARLKLMSYITSDFQSIKNDLKVGQMEWEKIMEENFKNSKMLEYFVKLYLKFGIKKALKIRPFVGI